MLTFRAKINADSFIDHKYIWSSVVYMNKKMQNRSGKQQRVKRIQPRRWRNLAILRLLVQNTVKFNNYVDLSAAAVSIIP